MKKLFSPWWLLIIAALGTGLLAWVYRGGWSIHPNANVNAEELGQLGDFFGGLLNPLVSVLTLFVAISVWRLQKDELELTRNEMAQTKLAMEDQAKTSELQRQEQRFFDLLNLYQRTVDSITHVDQVSSSLNAPVIQSSGKQALSNWLASSLPPELSKFRQDGLNNKRYRSGPDKSYQITEESLIAEWNNSNLGNQFDHYLRVVFRLLTESEALLCDQHYRYVKLLRAQLSRAELILIGFNLWLDEEGKSMAPLAAKYGLLKHLPKGHLRTQLEKVASPNVFGRKFATSQASVHSSETHPC